MSEQTSNSEIVAALAEEFVERCRQGERPPVSEYVDKHPELADEIKDLFPALVMLEGLAPEHDASIVGGEPESAPATPMVEQLGDYRILREVGRGGMGVVYEAEQVSLGRHVALKVLPQNLLTDDQQKRRFEREAKAAAKLHHTNIVPVFGVGEHDGMHYYVMQFIQGLGLDEVLVELKRMQKSSSSSTPAAEVELPVHRHSDRAVVDVARSLLTGTFHERLASDDPDSGAQPTTIAPSLSPSVERISKPESTAATSSTARFGDTLVHSGSISLPGQSPSENNPKSQAKKLSYWQSVATMGVQVASALQHAHDQGIQHRDIKPSNLLLDLRGTVWVTDFGLAKAEDQQNLTHTGDVLGTLRYLPPEAFAGKADNRGDLYSLGVTLYEMAALRPAFEERNRNRLIKQVTQESPERLEKRNRSIPRDLVTIIHKAIERDPSHRYRTGQDLAEDLQRFIDDEPIKARRISLAERFLRWARHNKGLAAALSAVALLLLTVAIGSALVARYYRQTSAQMTGLVADKELEKTKAVQAGAEAIRARNESRLQLAESLLDRGLRLAEQGEAAKGLHWMLEALRTAPTDAAGLRRVARVNLNAFADQVHGLRHVEPFTERLHCVALSSDGSKVVAGTITGLHLLRADTLERLGKPIPCNSTALAAAFSPNGKLLISGHGNGEVLRWETATGRRIGRPLPHPDKVSCIAFRPDGGAMVTGCDDGKARLWEVSTGELLATLEHDKAVRGVAFSPDGKTVLTGIGRSHVDPLLPTDTGAACFWDAAEGKLLRQPQPIPSPVLSVTFNPNGRTMAAGCVDGTCLHLSTSADDHASPPLHHRGSVSYTDFSQDGMAIAAASGESTLAFLWDAASGRRIGTPLWHPGEIYGIAVHSARGLAVTTGGERAMRTWELGRGLSRPAAPDRSRRERARPKTTTGSQLPDYLMNKTIAYSRDRTTVLTSNGESVARLWDTVTGRPLGPPLRHPDHVRTVAFSPQGVTVATGTHAGTIHLWTTQGRPLRQLQCDSWVSALAFSPDGTLLASGGYHALVQLWDVATGMRAGPPLRQDGIVFSLEFSPDGRKLAVGTVERANQARLWDVASRRPIGKKMPHQNWVVQVAFSSDGKKLLTRSHDRTARVWDAATGEPITGSLRHHHLSCVAFRPDGRVVATGGRDARVRLWDAETGRPLPGRTLVHDEPVSALCFSPDGKCLGVGCRDGSARLWDAATAKPLGPRLVQRYVIKDVAFLPDGNSFLATAEDGGTRLWPVPQPLDGSLEKISLRLQVRTGMKLDSGRAVAILSHQEWDGRRRRLIAEEGTVEKAYGFSVDRPAYHEARARDAEQDRNSFAAVWHLDRLIAARPDDWFLQARRGRAHTRAGQFADAELDFDRALKLGPAPALRDWFSHQLLECEAYVQDEAKRWYLKKLADLHIKQ